MYSHGGFAIVIVMNIRMFTIVGILPGLKSEIGMPPSPWAARAVGRNHPASSSHGLIVSSPLHARSCVARTGGCR
eukprot:2110907-Pyramimonas_sp.AAC.1